MELPDLKSGVYKHKSGEYYLVVGYIRDHETGNVSVAYIPLYTKEGYTGPRMTYTSLKRWNESFTYHGPGL